MFSKSQLADVVAVNNYLLKDKSQPASSGWSSGLVARYKSTVGIKLLEAYKESKTSCYNTSANPLINPFDNFLGDIDILKTEDDNMCMIIYDDRSVVDLINESSVSGRNLAVLNFANAVYPGGGYLALRMAQEEAMCYSSSLYYSLEQFPEFYENNKANINQNLFTNSMLYSENVVFFRDKDLKLQSNFSFANILTCPAVNYTSAKNFLTWSNCEKVMAQRMENILKLFAIKGEKDIVLGAFGCGVFGCDLGRIMNIWKSLIFDKGYGKLFGIITFCIKDENPEILEKTKSIIGE